MHALGPGEKVDRVEDTWVEEGGERASGSDDERSSGPSSARRDARPRLKHACFEHSGTMAQPALTVTESIFGELPDGRKIRRFDLGNGSMTASLLDYGATLLSVQTRDRQSVLEEVTLNRDTVEGLLTKNAYYGSTVGRVANRIADAEFRLEGKVYKLAANNGPNHLHGGLEGFDRKIWEAEPVKAADAVGVRFRLQSADGEEGYPGALSVQVTYRLTAGNELEMDFRAESDQPTPVALTNHAYWNLSGNLRRPVHDHTLRVAATHFLELGPHQIPTGKLAPVEGTPFDLRQAAPLGEHIPQIDGGGKPGFDHCFAVDGYSAGASQVDKAAASAGAEEEEDDGIPATARFFATLHDPASGRAMDVHGTQPGVQVYTANWLNADGDEPAGSAHVQHGAVCLETEFYPNAPNDPSAASEVILRPGKVYRHFTRHRFYTTD